MLERFTRRAEQQAELDALGADMVGVVQGTLEPEGRGAGWCGEHDAGV